LNSLLITGAILAFAVGIAHSWLGERYILVRLFRREDLPRVFGSAWFTKRTLRFAWHLTTLAWWGFGLVLWIYATCELEGARTAVLKTISLTFLLSGFLSAGFTRGKHLSWVVFLAIALLSWLAAK
jgi:hypothetical protein